MGEHVPEIVLVEDNPDDERLVERALKKSSVKHQLTVLRDGEEAAAWFERRAGASQSKHDMPSVILMDHRVPKLSGLELLSRIRSDQRFATVPVVMMSSGAEQRDVSEFFTAGANSVISKSMDWSEAMRQLPATIEYWITINQIGA